MKNVTLKDIAQETGISIATINRVIWNSGYVSQEKRTRVQEAILALGYVPKRKIAQTKDTALIGHFAPSNKHPLFSRLSEEISHVALANKFLVINIYVNGNDSAQTIVRQIDMLLLVGVKGIILNSLADRIDFIPISKYLRSLPVPIVMMERTANIYNVNKVLINAQESLFLAVKHLVDKGHRQIALFSPEADTHVEKSRKDGFFVAAKTFNIQSSVLFHPTAWYSSEDGYSAMDKYLSSHSLPTAVIAADSLMVGMLQLFYERGIRVPQDVSLVGLDNTFSSLTSPMLTTIAFPEKQMCEATIELILGTSSDGQTMRTAREISLSPYLIDRNSVTKL